MYEGNLEDSRKLYLDKQDEYSKILEIAFEKLETSIKRKGIHCQIEKRIKNVDSFLKKILRKEYKTPLTEIRDQIGLRVITHYQHEFDKVKEIVYEEFEVHHHEDKLNSLKFDQLGYLGLHYEVSLQKNENELIKDYNEHIFELQIHTKAQNLWANVSHQLLYKSFSPPSPEIQRSIYRLVALIEIFDKEVNTAQNAIINQTGFPEVKLLTHLESCFHLFTWNEFDKEFSINNLSSLKKLLKDEEIDNFENLIEAFSSENHTKLANLFSQYSDDKRDSYDRLMLFQPESLLIFERLEMDKFKLQELWGSFLPLELLEFLANIWGIQLPNS